MAGNVKGITIQFKGETSQLEQAIRKVNSSTKDIDKNLREVNNALKFNPTKVDLWRQKQDLLKSKIKETENNLKSLKNMQSQLDAKGVDKNSAEYQKLQREIITTESKLKTFKGQLNQVGNVKLKAASEQFKQWGSSLEEAGRQMQGISMAAGALVASLGAISYKAGQNADDLNAVKNIVTLSEDKPLSFCVKVENSDLIVLSTPIYTWYCTPPMKALLDRMVYAFNMYYGEKRGPSLWEGKQVAVVTTCGYPPEKGADLFEEGIKRFCRHSKLEYLGMICEQNKGYQLAFMDEEKTRQAKEFAEGLLK